MKIGNIDIDNLYFGLTQVEKCYFGQTLVWSAGSPPGPQPLDSVVDLFHCDLSENVASVIGEEDTLIMYPSPAYSTTLMPSTGKFSGGVKTASNAGLIIRAKDGLEDLDLFRDGKDFTLEFFVKDPETSFTAGTFIAFGDYRATFDFKSRYYINLSTISYQYFVFQLYSDAEDFSSLYFGQVPYRYFQDNFVHVALVYTHNSKNLRIFFDGTALGSVTIPDIVYSSGKPTLNRIYLGTTGGLITYDEIRFTQEALWNLDNSPFTPPTEPYGD